MRRGYRSARQAAAELGISVPTLYAYVSRGLIRSEGERSSRQRLYRVEDIAALKARKQRRDPDKVAEAALHFGLPVLDSAISLIAGGHLYYRGRDVATLATTATIEEIAALLWTGDAAADRDGGRVAHADGPLPDGAGVRGRARHRRVRPPPRRRAAYRVAHPPPPRR